MRSIFLIGLLAFICHLTILAQAVYVDSNVGDDENCGTEKSPVYSIHKALEIIRSRDNDSYTVKINPGIYILDKRVSVATEKPMTGKRIVIEASILPDDSSWTPEKMPVIASRAKKGEIPENAHFVVCFRIDESRVTIRGIKFHGYFYPHTRYCPIGRLDKTKRDLLVEQCVFIGDPNISQLHVGIYADGDEVKIDHCIFYKVRNTVVFGRAQKSGFKRGNGITNSIIYGASQGIWTAIPDSDFRFENNIVSDCRYVWVKNDFNRAKYFIDNCVIVNNEYYQGVPDSVRLKPGKFEIEEHNVTKEGKISLRLTGNDDMPALDCVDKPLPFDYLHIIPGSLGYEMGAGIFKRRKL
jgi:hypothetical protein